MKPARTELGPLGPLGGLAHRNSSCYGTVSCLGEDHVDGKDIQPRVRYRRTAWAAWAGHSRRLNRRRADAVPCVGARRRWKFGLRSAQAPVTGDGIGGGGGGRARLGDCGEVMGYGHHG